MTSETDALSFVSFAEEVVRKTSPRPRVTPDALEFVTSSEYLNENPTPYHRLCLKILYNLWSKYGVDAEEQALLDILRDRWQITIDLSGGRKITTLVLAVGRRGRKSSLICYVGAYEACKLICKYNPQEYYKLRERQPVHIPHIAASGDQAKEVFTLTKDLLRRSPFFRPYIDFDKDTETELRLFTPYDLALNEQVKLRNRTVERGEMKETRLPGSVYIESFTTSSMTKRGRSIIALLISEFAHFERARYSGTGGVGDILSFNPQTDYAIFRSLEPSTKDYGDDGLVILESSPRERGGEFYHHYCLGGGSEQEDPSPPLPGYQVIQFATWEANPTISYESLESERISDPIGFNMEWGGHFGNPVGAAVDVDEFRKKVIAPGTGPLYVNPQRWQFIICVDPGGQSKNKVGDAYAIAWGHYEFLQHQAKFFVNGLHGFVQQVTVLPGGERQVVKVNPTEVTSFLLGLCNDLGGRNFILEICYDQWNDADPISQLQASNLPAVETTFTNAYKAVMYETFFREGSLGNVVIYDQDPLGWVRLLFLEVKYLQRQISGGTVYYSHPSTGPVRTDDFADVCANLVYRLHRLAYPTKEVAREGVRVGRAPLVSPVIIVPRSGPGLWRAR